MIKCSRVVDLRTLGKVAPGIIISLAFSLGHSCSVDVGIIVGMGLIVLALSRVELWTFGTPWFLKLWIPIQAEPPSLK